MARTFYATNFVTADGTTVRWPFSFAGVQPGVSSGTLPYLSSADIKAVEMFVDSTGVKQAVERQVLLEYPNVATILGAPVENGRVLKIYRQTEIRFPLVDYRDQQEVSEFDLDLANRQAVFLAQEAMDAATSAMTRDAHENLDAGNQRIVNLSPGVADTDAVNLSQLKTAIRGPANDGPLRELKPKAERRGCILAFDGTGEPYTTQPNSETALGLQVALASTGGAGMIGMEDGETVETAFNVLYHQGAEKIHVGTQTLKNWMDYKVSVTDSIDGLPGADPTGLTDSTAAFQRAANKTLGDVRVPAGEYLLSDTIYKVSGRFVGDGFHSKCVFTNMNGKDGFVFAPVTEHTTSGCNYLSILCRGTHGGRAIRTPEASTQYFTYRSHFDYAGLRISGYTKPVNQAAGETVEEWEIGISQGDGNSFSLKEVLIVGAYRADTPMADQQRSIGMRLNAVAGLMTAYSSHITVVATAVAVDIGNRVFFNISQFDFAANYDCLYQSGTTAFGESKITHGNMNAQRYGIYFKGIGSREIDGVIIRRHRFGNKQADHEWAGIYLDTCNYMWVTNCQVQPDASQGEFAGTAVGYKMVNCGGVNVDNCVVGLNLARGFEVNNCTMVSIDATTTYQDKTTQVLFYMGQNTRESHIGTYHKVSSFKGKEYDDDGTIQANGVRRYQEHFVPNGSAPYIALTRPTNGVDEKTSRWTQSSTNYALQFEGDDKSISNVMLFHRQGKTCTSVEVRAQRLKIATGPEIIVGSAAPEGTVAATPGSMYLLSTDTPGASHLFTKTTGTGNTGWRRLALEP